MALAAEQNSLAHTDFRAFCASVKLALETAGGTRPPQAPVLESALISRRVTLPASGRRELITRIGKQWSVNGHLWTGMTWEPGGTWAATVNRGGVRAYRDATDIPQFVAAEERRINAGAGPVPAELRLAAAIPTVAADHLPSWFSALPDSMTDDVGTRMLSGHREDAFVQAWKTLSSELSEAADLSLDGVDLVNQAYRKLQRSTSSASQRNEYEGYVEMMRGLARLRNVHAHPGARPLTDLEVTAFISMCGACISWVRSFDWASVQADPSP
ncbi:TIGR02391 family protein [uncultured Nocardioides sp.]|uniref:TIGR02391 family protein n=1 Tax=uncultured Nocardioides sp. TaxID=198441 RepID=UPI0026042A9D|nr:TIGR02391 family protein [uncultured Nocardioides sp.]